MALIDRESIFVEWKSNKYPATLGGLVAAIGAVAEVPAPAKEIVVSNHEITEVDIKRSGDRITTLHVQPINEYCLDFARIISMHHDKNGKYSLNTFMFGNLLIYLSCTEEDRRIIWNDPPFMKSHNIDHPWDGVTKLLTFSERDKVLDVIFRISGFDKEE